ncbi:MAG: hypothetical protein ACPG4W_04335 [Flavobacteriales bacterium]
MLIISIDLLEDYSVYRLLERQVALTGDCVLNESIDKKNVLYLKRILSSKT